VPYPPPSHWPVHGQDGGGGVIPYLRDVLPAIVYCSAKFSGWRASQTPAAAVLERWQTQNTKQQLRRAHRLEHNGWAVDRAQCASSLYALPFEGNCLTDFFAR
jgi:hypothetical protein